MSQHMKPGDRIAARCTRCKDVTGHVIVAFVDGAIARVECRACGSNHKYYSADQDRHIGKTQGIRDSVPGRTKAKKQTSGMPKNTDRKSRLAAEKAEQAWREALESSAGRRAKAYALDLELSPGDVVEHPLFGTGSVQAVQRPDKAEVLFYDGKRLLRCRC